MTATTNTELFCYNTHAPEKSQTTINDPGKQILTIWISK